MNTVKTIAKTEMPNIMFVIWLANVRMLQASRRTKSQTPPILFPLFWGGVGIGKSSIIKEFANFHVEKFKSTFFSGGVQKLNLASMDGSDFEMPVADHARGCISRLVAVPFSKNPQIILVDEVNRFLTHDSINAFSRIVLDRDGASVPCDGSFVVACANTMSSAGTKELPEHVLNRACHIYLSEDGANDSNLAYLSKVSEGKIPDWMIETFKLNETISRDDHEDFAKDTPRSREYATWIAIAANDAEAFGIEVSDTLLFVLLAGVVGQSEASKLLAARKMAKLPSLGDVLASPSTVAIPSSNVDHGLRKNHALHLIASTKNNRDAGLLLTYFLRFDGEFQRYCIEALVESVPSLKDRHEYKAWMTR